MTLFIGACSNRIDIDYLTKTRQDGTAFPSELVEVTIHIDEADPPRDVSGIWLGGEAVGHICKGSIPNHPKARSVRLQRCFGREFRTLIQVHSTLTLLYTSDGKFYEIRDAIDHQEPHQRMEADNERDPMDLRDSD